MLEAAVTYYYMNDPAPGSGRLPGAPQLVYLAADSFARLICTLITGAVHHCTSTTLLCSAQPVSFPVLGCM